VTDENCERIKLSRSLYSMYESCRGKHTMC
jgi:hypothetical protein